MRLFFSPGHSVFFIWTLLVCPVAWGFVWFCVSLTPLVLFGKRGSGLRNASTRLACREVCGASSWWLTGVGGSIPWWAGSSLGRWSWVAVPGSFSLLPYTTQPKPWSPSLCPTQGYQLPSNAISHLRPHLHTPAWNCMYVPCQTIEEVSLATIGGFPSRQFLFKFIPSYIG